MKKRMVILFRIFYVCIFIFVIFAIVFVNIKRMKGDINVTLNGEKYPLEYVECEYVGEEASEEKIKYKETSSGLTFKNPGFLHGLYEYSFLISNDEISITPKINVFKSNNWKIYRINIDVQVYEDNGIWNADISSDLNGRIHQETVYDIENNIIEFRVE